MQLLKSILGGMVGVIAATVLAADPAIRPLSREDAVALRLDAARAALAAHRPEARPAHMLRYPVTVIAGAPPAVPPLRDAFLPRMRWDHMRNSDVWTRAAMSALEGHGDGLEDFVPRDIADWCPGYADRSEQERQAFWVGLFSALSKHESTYRPWAVGGGGQWYGLLQVWPTTARHFRCRARSGEALLDPVENLSCSVRIASYQVQRRGTVARGMRDWGPFHNAAKRRDMAAWTRGQGYCQPVETRRPVARPEVLLAQPEAGPEAATGLVARVSTKGDGSPGSD